MAEWTVVSRPKREDVRRAIIEAGVRVFAAEVYNNANIAKIAELAGFTKGAVYSNFSSKPELFTAVMTHHLNTERGGIMQVVLTGLNEAESTQQLVENLSLELARALPDLAPWQIALDQFRSLAQRDLEISAVYNELSRTRIATVVEMCASHEAARDLLTRDLELFATTLLYLVNILCLELAARQGALADTAADQSTSDDQAVTERNAEILRRALEGMIR